VSCAGRLGTRVPPRMPAARWVYLARAKFPYQFPCQIRSAPSVSCSADCFGDASPSNRRPAPLPLAPEPAPPSSAAAAPAAGLPLPFALAATAASACAPVPPPLSAKPSPGRSPAGAGSGGNCGRASAAAPAERAAAGDAMRGLTEKSPELSASSSSAAC